MLFRFHTQLGVSPGTSKKPPLKKGWLFVILLALFTPHLIDFFLNISDSIAPDLLLRTIGSHLQDAGKPFYEYKWQQGDPVSWLNPYPDRRMGVNGVVSTPFLLWLLQPLAQLDYCSIKKIWGILEQLLMFGTLWFSCLIFTTRTRQIAFILVACLFFIYSRNWALHLYNGQVYIIHAFVFSVCGYLATKYKNNFSGIITFVMMIAIRPFFVAAVIPLFKFGKKQILYALLALVLIVGLSALTTSKSEWVQYSSAMSMYAKEATGELQFDTSSHSYLTKFADVCTRTPNDTFTVFGAGCLFSLQHYLQLTGILISSVLFYQICLVAVMLFLWWFAFKRRWLDDLPKQLLLAFLFYQLCELLSPASRNPYNMVQWLPAIAWLFFWGERKILILVLAGLFLNHDFPFRFSYGREIGEMTLFYSIAVFLFKQRNRLILG